MRSEELTLYFEFLKKILLWIKEKNFLECQSLFSFRWLLISFLSSQWTADIASSTWCTTRTTADWNSSRLIHIPTTSQSAFATSLKPQISIMAHADKRSGTSPVSGAATGLASITNKHHHNNKINLPSYRFWSYEIKCTLRYVFFQEKSFDIPSYVLDRSSLLKSKLACWWMDEVPSETIVVRSIDSKLPIWTHPHPHSQREKEKSEGKWARTGQL